MTQLHDNTTNNTGKHLTLGERYKIEAYLEEGHSYREMGRRLGHHHTTISNEIKRGTVRQVRKVTAQTGKVYEYYDRIYSPEAGQYGYEQARLACGRPPKWIDLADFLDWADDKMLVEQWSPDAVLGYAERHNLFPECDLPCTTTLYEWIERGIMKTKNIDLLEKCSRRPRKDKKVTGKPTTLGTSIKERPEEVDSRGTFGHWELDTVIGVQDATDDVLLTLVERQTRFEYLIRLKAKTSEAVTEAMQKLMEELGEDALQLFKTATVDNGLEFAGLEEAFEDDFKVYYCHAYSSWERGTSENQHKLIRRFIPKCTRIDQVSDRQLKRVQQWMNDYPRKQFGYATAHELFARALYTQRHAA